MAQVLVLKPVPLLRMNGGDISLLERLKIMATWGLSIKVVMALPEADKAMIHKLLEVYGATRNGETYLLDGISCEMAWSKEFHPHDLKARPAMQKFFRGALETEKPSLVWTHYTDYFATAAALDWNADRVWIDQTDDEYPRLDKLKNFENLAEIYSKAKFMTVASGFMKASVKRAFPKVRTLMTPNPILNYQKISRRSKVWMADAPWIHVNPAAVKGIDFTIELARALPNEKFLIVGNWGAEMPKNLPKNVQTLDRQGSMQELFATAKGLLVPSRWQEAFGRLPLEAMACGLPVIASDHGGLPESVGQGGVLLPLQKELWIDAMSRAEAFWKPQIEAGYKQFLEYRKRCDRRYAALKRLWKI